MNEFNGVKFCARHKCTMS